MSMMRSLDAGVSGLKNFQTGMDTIGDNISNVSTTGYKASRASFQSMLSQTLQGASGSTGSQGGTNPIQIGMGMALASVDTNFTSGTLQSTGISTDLAVSGEGFFVVQNGAQQYYTRNGNFYFDNAGNYVSTGTSYKVMGWMADDSGKVATGGAAVPLVKPNASMAAKQTTTATITGNINSNTPAGWNAVTSQTVYDSLGSTHNLTNTYYRVNQDSANPTNTWYCATSVTGATGLTNQFSKLTFNTDGSIKSNVTITPVAAGSLVNTQTATFSDLKLTTTGTQNMGFAQIDAAGEMHSYQMSFKYNDTTKDWTATVTEPGGKDSTKVLYTDTITWDGTSSYVSANAASSTSLFTYTDSAGTTNTLNLALAGGTQAAPDANGISGFITADDNIDTSITSTTQKDLTCNIKGAQGMTINTKLSGVTQSAVSTSNNSSLALTADGYESGKLSNVSFDSSGAMIGTFSNGKSRTLGQVALASFSNSGGLTKVGSTLFAKSDNSGEAQLGVANSGNKGKVIAAQLEGSNVDLTQQFSDMIVTQRAFQSNSKIITTSDTMLEELVNLKR